MREEFAPRCIALGHFLLEEYKLYVPNCFAALKGIGSVRADGLLPRENGLIPNENSIRISVPEGEKEIDMEEKIMYYHFARIMKEKNISMLFTSCSDINGCSEFADSIIRL